MRKRNYQRIITAAFLSVLLIIEGSFPLSAYAQETSAQDAISDIEACLEYEGETYCEEELKNNDEIEYDGYIFKLKDDVSACSVKEIEQSIEGLADSDAAEELQEGSVYAADSLDTIEEIAPAEDIEYIEPDVQCEVYGEVSGFTASPNDPYLTNNSTAWPWKNTNVYGAWSYGIFGQNINGSGSVKIAIIDTGITSTHPDLKSSNIAKGQTIIQGKYEDGAQDEIGHGTFVAGVIAASMNNGVGVSGSMPGVEILPIKIFQKTSAGVTAGGSVSDVIRGINLSMDEGADVINMSLGTKTQTRAMDDACAYAIDKGVILVAAVGNDSSSVISYPAGCAGVIGVGSLTQNNARASSSNYNVSVDAMAPGSGTYGLAIGTAGNPESFYKKGSGTSYASPAVAALAGMAKSIDGDITAAQFEELLSETCRDLGTAGRDDEYGYGVIDYGAMAELMLEERGLLSKDEDDNNDNQAETEVETVSVETEMPTEETKETEEAKPVSAETQTPDSAKEEQESQQTEATPVPEKEKSNEESVPSNITSIAPKSTNIASCTKGRTHLTIKWIKQTELISSRRISGYQVQIARNKTFTKGKKSSKVSGYTATSRKFSGLKHKTAYYVRVRTYITVDGKTYYSKWSGVKKYNTK